MRIVVVAVGRLRPPFVDDIAHYTKLLSRYARLELIEVREDEWVSRRLPERAFVSLLDSAGQTLDSVGFSEFLEQRRASGLDLCFVIGGPFGGLARQASRACLRLGHPRGRGPARKCGPELDVVRAAATAAHG